MKKIHQSMNIAEDSLKIEHSALPPKPLTSKIVSTPIYSAKRRGKCIMIRVTAITQLNEMVASAKAKLCLFSRTLQSRV